MKLAQIAEMIGAKVFTHPELARRIEIERVYAGDRMSELLNEASLRTLLVSNLANPHLLRVSALLDAPGICLLNGMTPSEDLIAAADENGKVLMVSPVDMFETCRRLSALPIVGASRATA